MYLRSELPAGVGPCRILAAIATAEIRGVLQADGSTAATSVDQGSGSGGDGGGGDGGD